MEAFVKELQGRVENELKNIDPLSSAVKGYDHRSKIMKNAIAELKKYIANHPFADQAAEIYCFKHVLPFFLSQYYYFGMVCEAEEERNTSGQKNFRHFLENELEKIKTGFHQYGDFYKYYLKGREALDAQYYTRASWEIWEDPSVFPDENSSLGSVKASWIMADERYRDYLNRELRGPGSFNNEKEAYHVEFRGTKSAAAEFSIAITEAKILYFDGQPGTLKQVTEWVENFLRVDLRNLSSIDQQNRERKKEATPFLDMLRDKYNSRTDRLLD